MNIGVLTVVQSDEHATIARVFTAAIEEPLAPRGAPAPVRCVGRRPASGAADPGRRAADGGRRRPAPARTARGAAGAVLRPPFPSPHLARCAVRCCSRPAGIRGAGPAATPSHRAADARVRAGPRRAALREAEAARTSIISRSDGIVVERVVVNVKHEEVVVVIVVIINKI